jgi:predicted DNA-binding transcriptional regulator AlpA
MKAYRFRDLRAAGVPFVRKHIATLEKRGDFPQHFQLGQNSVAWVGEEVDHWVEQRIRARVPRRTAPVAGEQPAVDSPAASA